MELRLVGVVSVYKLVHEKQPLNWCGLSSYSSESNLGLREDFWKNEGVNPVIFLKERLKADFEL